MKARVILVSLATLALSLIALPAHAAASATFVKVSDWGTGFEGRVTVTNGTSTPMNGWNVAFDIPAGFTIPSAWDAVLTRSGQRHTFTNPSWASALAPGASVSFGFNGSPGNFPGISNCTINGASCDGGSGPGGVPGKPGAVTANPSGTAIALSWGASGGTVTGYRVYEGTTVKATVTATGSTIGGLGACETHTYTVKAYNAAGESPASDPVTATTTGCDPGQPGGHAAQALPHRLLAQLRQPGRRAEARGGARRLRPDRDRVRRGHLAHRARSPSASTRSCRGARRLHRRPVQGRRAGAARSAARRSSCPSAARPAGCRWPTPPPRPSSPTPCTR